MAPWKTSAAERLRAGQGAAVTRLLAPVYCAARKFRFPVAGARMPLGILGGACDRLRPRARVRRSSNLIARVLQGVARASPHPRASGPTRHPQRGPTRAGAFLRPARNSGPHVRKTQDLLKARLGLRRDRLLALAADGRLRVASSSGSGRGSAIGVAHRTPDVAG